jgi:hypothetical protein
MTRHYAPIALFVYARPDHARRTIEALQRNSLAEASDLVIFSDAPKRAELAVPVAEVRDYVRSVEGFKSINIVERARNLGLAQSIVTGVTSLCDSHGRVIVLEDDLVTSPSFLSFMNDALDFYSNTPRVAAISGYHPPFSAQMPETFFQRDADCWGWATWQRAWAKFNPNGQELLSEIRRRNLSRAFDQDNSYPYTHMLEEQVAGRNDSWAIRWRASVFLSDMLSVYPRESLVCNIGLDGSGTHGGAWGSGSSEFSGEPIRVADEPVAHSNPAFREYVRFNRLAMGRNFKSRLARKLSRLASTFSR